MSPVIPRDLAAEARLEQISDSLRKIVASTESLQKSLAETCCAADAKLKLAQAEFAQYRAERAQQT